MTLIISFLEMAAKSSNPKHGYTENITLDGKIIGTLLFFSKNGEYWIGQLNLIKTKWQDCITDTKPITSYLTAQDKLKDLDFTYNFPYPSKFAGYILFQHKETDKLIPKEFILDCLLQLYKLSITINL